MTDDFGGSSKNIEKLNDSNFNSWKQKIVLILALKDLDDFIEDYPQTEITAFENWVKNDHKVRAIIGCSLSNDHAEHVRAVDTAKEMWNAIMNVFQQHTLLNKLFSRRTFYTVIMEKGEIILTYLNRVKQLSVTQK